MSQRNTVHSIIALSRWKEYFSFVLPLTIIGALLATNNGSAVIDQKLIFVCLANLGSVAYAFMLNDIEDADDDRHDPQKAKRNPVSANKISKTAAYTACRLIAFGSLLFYALAGSMVLWIGVFTLLISHLYSWKTIRLKAWPLVDILSHSLMLSALLMISAYYAYASTPGVVWYVIAGATLFSVYGQLYNQIRDYKVDKQAGLKNTAILLGKARTQMLIYVTLVFAFVCLGISLLLGLFPYWLIFPLILGVFVGRKFQTKTDFAGTAVVDVTGSLQLGALIVINLIAFVWLIEVLLRQYM